MKLKKVWTHRQRKHKEELKIVHERNFENSKNFPGTFNLGSVVQVVILVHLLKKGTYLIVKGN